MSNMIEKKFTVIAGPRLSGKTTLCGTLPDNALLLQAAVFESGADTAEAKAKKLGHNLVTHSFENIPQILKQIERLKKDTKFDYLYVDGFSALTEMKSKEADYIKLAQKDSWGAYRLLGEQVSNVVLELKRLCFSQHAAKPKHVFLTAALKIKTESSGHVDVELEATGRMAVTTLTKLAPCILCNFEKTLENGKQQRMLLTRSSKSWPGRIGGVLDEDNPGEIIADLREFLKIIDPIHTDTKESRKQGKSKTSGKKHEKQDSIKQEEKQDPLKKEEKQDSIKQEEKQDPPKQEEKQDMSKGKGSDKTFDEFSGGIYEQTELD